MKIFIKSLFLLSLLLMLPSYADYKYESNNDIIIAGGNPFGLRYAQSGKLCYYFNKSENKLGECLTYPSKNSGAAIESLQQGKVNFAMVQSDWLAHVKDGTSRFSSVGKDDSIRVVSTLSIESVIIVVNKDSGIKTLSGLKGKKVDIGKDNTYRNIVSLGLLEVADLDEGDLKLSLNGSQDQAIDSVCKGTADGAIFILPNPNSVIDMMSAQCNISFVNLDEVEIKNFIKQYKGFYKTIVPNETYWSQENEIKTIGVYTVLITKIDTDKKLVQSLKDALVNNLDDFAKTHPMLYNINLENINSDVNVKYYDFD